MKSIQITDSQICASVFRSIWDSGKINKREQAYALYLNRKGEVIDHEMIGSGGYSSTSMDIRSLVVNAVEKNADSVAIAHNHPSGNATPSPDDESATNKLKSLLAALEIRLIEHIILTEDSYYSFRDSKLLNQ